MLYIILAIILLSCVIIGVYFIGFFKPQPEPKKVVFAEEIIQIEPIEEEQVAEPASQQEVIVIEPLYPEGKAISCLGEKIPVYRYTNGERRLYPSPQIASSWDAQWYKRPFVDCTSIPLGAPMEIRT